MSIPQAVLAELARWTNERVTGDLVLHFQAGEIVHMRPQPLVDVRAAEARLARACPACGDRMATRDGGALYVCPGCGAKRTAAQCQSGGG